MLKCVARLRVFDLEPVEYCRFKLKSPLCFKIPDALQQSVSGLLTSVSIDPFVMR